MNRKHMFLVALTVILTIGLQGCSLKYRGENPELYTVAIYNFFGSSGYSSNGEISFQSEIGIIEKDAYGRILFYYHEGILNNGCGYGIMQKSQDGYVYFYEDDCVLPAIDDWDGSGKKTHEEWFSEDELTAFKARNDWGLPLDEGKCTKETIVNEKPVSKLNLQEKDFDAAAKTYFSQQGITYVKISGLSHSFFTADDYGREMYCLYCDYYKEEMQQCYLAMVFNPDGSCNPEIAVLEIEDMTNYSETLKDFKLRNGWNTEYAAER